MPSERTPMRPYQKRKLDVEAEPTSSPLPTAKRRKLWDNLSQQWLTRRTLQEFNRRTVWPALPIPLLRTNKANINLAELKRFARHGGPSLGDIRGYPHPKPSVSSRPTMDSSQSSSRKRAKTGRESGTSSSTRKTSAYDPAFAQHLIDHGIHPEGRDDDEGFKEPANIEAIHDRLARSRSSLSPSRFTRKDFLEFKQKNRNALTEDTVMSQVFPIVAGNVDTYSQENLFFRNLKPLTDDSITKARPDFYDGVHPEQLNKKIRERLSEYIEPSTKKNAPLLPNFFTEGKGPDGSASVGELQAMYDGALGARGFHELRSYIGQEALFDNNAYTITSTYHGGSGALKLYATHPTRSIDPKRDYEFYLTQLRGWDMTDSVDTFRQGARALRNARELAKEKREELIAAANSKLPDAEHSDLVSSTRSVVSLSSDKPVRLDSDTSADELALDTNATSSRGTLIGARTNHLLSNPRSKKKPLRTNKVSATRYRDLQEIKG